jgi:hypothetical protein
MKDLTRNRLYLHCEECESGWADPNKVGAPGARFLTLDEEFDAEPATHDDLCQHGWPTDTAQRFADAE